MNASLADVSGQPATGITFLRRKKSNRSAPPQGSSQIRVNERVGATHPCRTSSGVLPVKENARWLASWTQPEPQHASDRRRLEDTATCRLYHRACGVQIKLW